MILRPEKLNMNVDKAEKTSLKCKKIKLAFEVSVIFIGHIASLKQPASRSRGSF